jgi:hypothetical protein
MQAFFMKELYWKCAKSNMHGSDFQELGAKDLSGLEGQRAD